nr:hypothetical protein [Halioglobus sp.]
LAAAGYKLGQGWSLEHTAAGWRLHGAGASALVNGLAPGVDQLVGGGDRIRIGTDPEYLLIEVTA